MFGKVGKYQVISRLLAVAGVMMSLPDDDIMQARMNLKCCVTVKANYDLHKALAKDGAEMSDEEIKASLCEIPAFYVGGFRIGDVEIVEVS